jgi:hypothetical protein
MPSVGRSHLPLLPRHRTTPHALALVIISTLLRRLYTTRNQQVPVAETPDQRCGNGVMGARRLGQYAGIAVYGVFPAQKHRFCLAMWSFDLGIQPTARVT